MHLLNEYGVSGPGLRLGATNQSSFVDGSNHYPALCFGGLEFYARASTEHQFIFVLSCGS
jgi:hypothetical protein